MKMQSKRYWNRYTRLVLIILLAVIVGVLTAYINKTYIESKVKLEKIVVAADNIKPYTELNKHNLIYREIVKSEIPADALYDLDEFLREGPMYSGEVGFVKGYPIKKALTSSTTDSVFGSAIALEKGKSYLGIATEQVSSQLVKPGTIVDVYCYLEEKAMNAPPTVISKLEEPLLAGLYVHSVKGKENENIDEKTEATISAVVVVETVSPEQTSKLIYYQMSGKVFLVPIGVDADKYLREMLQAESRERKS